MHSTQRRAAQQGAILIEALVGILIFSIGILAMIGMQAAAMRASMDAKYRSEASFLADEAIGDMWVDRANLGNYATDPSSPATCASPPTTQVCIWLERVASILPQATGANAPTIAIAGQQATVTVRWQRPGDTAVSNQVAVAQINGS